MTEFVLFLGELSISLRMWLSVRCVSGNQVKQSSCWIYS